MTSQSRAQQAERTRSQIQQVALRLFATQGYASTSLQDIATELGITKQAVHYHYRGKSQILNDVSAPARQALTDLMERVYLAEDQDERREVTIAGMVDLLMARRDVLSLAGQQIEFRQDAGVALTVQRIPEMLLVGLFGANPTSDQRFAVHSSTFALGIHTLDGIPEDEGRAVVERALRRLAAVS